MTSSTSLLGIATKPSASPTRMSPGLTITPGCDGLCSGTGRFSCEAKQSSAPAVVPKSREKTCGGEIEVGGASW